MIKFRHIVMASALAIAPAIGAFIHQGVPPGLPSGLQTAAPQLPPAVTNTHNDAPDKKPATTDTRIYGVVQLDNSFSPPYICSYAIDGDLDLQKLYGPSYDITCFYGGVYVDGFYYASNSNVIQKFDPENWSQGPVSSTPIDKTTMFRPAEMTYDVADKKVWAAYQKDFNNNYSIGSIDLASGQATNLLDLPAEVKCFGLAADAHGELFAILSKKLDARFGSEPSLYKVNKQTGALTHIVTWSSDYARGEDNSATFDLATGYIYWMADTYPLSTINKIDPATGERTIVGQMTNNEKMRSIYIPYDVTENDAPALLEDLDLTFTDISGNATVSFTVPVKTHSGDALSGNVSYTVSLDGTQLAQGSAEPGKKVSAPVAITTAGRVKLNVSLTSASGSTSKNNVIGFAGPDIPAAPVITAASADGNDVTVSWQAPARGANGGLIDPSKPLRYSVELRPSGQVIETSTTELTTTATLSLTQPTAMTAVVTATAGTLKGEEAVSAKFVAGPPFTAPWSEDFETPDSFELFTIDDVAADGATWEYSEGDYESYTRCQYSAENPKDDWLFTPGLALEAGKLYTLSFKASSQLTNAFPETLEVKLGNAPRVSAMTETLIEPEVVPNDFSWAWHDYLINITVETSGTYHIGFHALTREGAFCLAIDDISLQGAAMTAPAAASDVRTIPAADASNSATVTFTCPVLTVEGKALTSISEAEIYVNNRLVETIDNPAPGSEQTASFETETGANSVNILCINGSGRGFPAAASVWTGFDAPAAPANFRASLAPDGKGIVLTWDTPAGLHGGVLDTEDMEYVFARYVGGEQEIIGSEAGMINTYTDLYEPTAQTSVVYMIAARNATGDGKTGLSNIVIAGSPAYSLPFAETFASGYCLYPMWENQSLGGNSYWTMWNPTDNPGVTPYDNDNGAIAFSPVKVGDKVRIYSGVIDLKGAETPVVAFRYRGNKSTARLTLEGSANSGEWAGLRTITLSPTDDNEWKLVKVPVPAQFIGEGRFAIAFRGEALSDLSRIYLDDISVRQTYARDLGVTLEGRSIITQGEPSTLTATVRNWGDEPSGAYTVRILCGDRVLHTVEMEPLATDASAQVTYDVVAGLDADDKATYSADIIWDADLCADNNKATLTVRHRLPALPAPHRLMLGDSPMHALSWDAAAGWTPETGELTDDFESYDPFIIEDIGDWKVYDEKGSQVYGLIGFDFPHRNEAKSWQVFNLWALGVEMSDDEVTWRPNSGHQMLVSMCEADGKVDDWLISPPLSGDAQTISFYARSLYSFLYGEEDFEVYASSETDSPDDFERIMTGRAPDEWTRFTVDLPEGTRYFAIKCVSRGKYAMGLDDITYVRGDGIFETPVLKGYNVYRNGLLVNEAPVNGTAFETTGKSGDIYAVTALYDQGESRMSNRVRSDRDSSLKGLASDAATLGIRTEGRTIYVTGAVTSRVILVSPDGRTVDTAAPSALTRRLTAPAPGVYFVAADGARVKILVR